RLVHHIEGCALEWPDVPRTHHLKVKRRQGAAHLRESTGGDRDLGVFVIAARHATMEIDRPPRHHTPRNIEAAQSLSDLAWMPWVPQQRFRRLESPRRELLVDLPPAGRAGVRRRRQRAARRARPTPAR